MLCTLTRIELTETDWSDETAASLGALEKAAAAAAAHAHTIHDQDDAKARHNTSTKH